MPNTAVPKELPSVRKKVTPEAAVPKSEYATVFRTALPTIARPPVGDSALAADTCP
ncbi:hypothetical protein MRBLMF1_001249 [Streptomyces ossamyceticus]